MSTIGHGMLFKKLGIDTLEVLEAAGTMWNFLPLRPLEVGYDAIVDAVGHEEFRKLGAAGSGAHGMLGAVLYDVKYVLPRDAVDGRL